MLYKGLIFCVAIGSCSSDSSNIDQGDFSVRANCDGFQGSGAVAVTRQDKAKYLIDDGTVFGLPNREVLFESRRLKSKNDSRYCEAPIVGSSDSYIAFSCFTGEDKKNMLCTISLKK